MIILVIYIWNASQINLNKNGRAIACDIKSNKCFIARCLVLLNEKKVESRNIQKLKEWNYKKNRIKIEQRQSVVT